MTKIPAAPPGTGPAGRRLWRTILVAYQLSVTEDALLKQAVRTADHVDALDAMLLDEGLMVPGRDGVTRMHPALAEVRQQRLTYARLLSALRLPVEDSPSVRLQRRGIRGVYSTGVVS